MRKIGFWLVTGYLCVCPTLRAMDFSGFGDFHRPDSYWEALWAGEPNPLQRDFHAVCSAVLFASRWTLGIRKPPAPERFPRAVSHTGQIPVEVAPEEFIATRNKSKNNRGKIFQPKGSTTGIYLNGTEFPAFNLFVLPELKIPVAVLNPSKPPVGRVILLHGLGYSISTIYSVTSTALTLRNIAEADASDPFATWFGEQYPELKLPLQIVLIDVPPMGWAPSLEKLPTIGAMADHIRGVVAEINRLQPLRNFYVGRSASGPLSLLAGRDSTGVVITAATLPTQENLAANVTEIRRLEVEEGEKPDWDLIHRLVKMFESHDVMKALEKVAGSRLNVRSLIGRNDAETPWGARVGWANLFNMYSSPIRRSQHIIEGAGHQVFRRPPGLPSEIYSVADPEVVAFRLMLDFIRELSVY